MAGFVHALAIGITTALAIGLRLDVPTVACLGTLPAGLPVFVQPGCALVGQPVMHGGYGGRTRLLTPISGVSLLAMILLARHWLTRIPMAPLAGVMTMIAIT
ncbi:protein of unknown function [Cyanobium sp. NIES-981]|nr:protein of unknown function [Cyanobium sp. NIES-981]